MHPLITWLVLLVQAKVSNVNFLENKTNPQKRILESFCLHSG